MDSDVYVENHDDNYNYLDMESEYHDNEDGLYYDPDDRVGYLTELYESCAVPSIEQAVSKLFTIYAACLALRIFVMFLPKATSPYRRILPHIASTCLGIYCLYHLFYVNLIYLVALCILAYSVIFVMGERRRSFLGVAITTVVLIYLLTCELFVVERTVWHQIRGSQMALAMRLISVGFDLANDQFMLRPNPLAFAGYALSPAVVLFGPWFSFADYQASMVLKNRRCTFTWMMKCCEIFFVGLLCIVHSNCTSQWIFSGSHNEWLIAYRDAQSFRFSHYFISFTSELTMLLTGALPAKADDFRRDNNIQVSRPFSVELPRSLVDVVVYWNIPMHTWLKNYSLNTAASDVFRIAKAPFGVLPAILITYAASALLHGLNFQLSAVLLSLGVYSYVEYQFRDRLADLFSACVAARACKSADACPHTYGKNDSRVWLVNIGFTCLALYHLSYLGLMFDNSDTQEQGYTMWYTLEKWSDLNFMSHYVVAGTYLFYKLI